MDSLIIGVINARINEKIVKSDYLVAYAVGIFCQLSHHYKKSSTNIYIVYGFSTTVWMTHLSHSYYQQFAQFTKTQKHNNMLSKNVYD